MKRQYIYILIGIISLALIGLIAVQVYWVDNAVTLKEEEFKRDVNVALFSVVNKLEKIEAIKQVKTHKRGRELFMQHAKRMQSSVENSAYATDTTYEENGVKYQVKEKRQNNQSGEVYQKSIQTTSPNSQSSFHLNIGVQGWNTFSTNLNNDSLYEYQKREKVTIIDEVLKDLYNRNIYRPISERVEKKMLDSLIREELKARNIEANFQYGIFDYHGGGLLVDSLSNLDEIRQSGKSVV